eukprot:1158571-Pelagomonas_calceolata.AAC.9
MMEKTEIPACWKVSKITLLYKKGSVLDPRNYACLQSVAPCTGCMLTFSGRWSLGGAKKKTKFQTLSLHSQHAAQVKRPDASPRLHAAFIDFKQAYDTIPREALWTHLQRICMPTCLLATTKSINASIYANDGYILVDGCKQARVHPHLGDKQGCPLSPFVVFPVHSMTWIVWQRMCKVLSHAVASRPQSASNQPQQLQLMLSRLHVHAQWKRLVSNVAWSEIVHFNSRGDNVPVFTLGGARLVCVDFFAEHMCAPFVAGRRWIRQFASEFHLMDRPHTMLWLTRAYALLASMYAWQIWGTRFMKGVEMYLPLLTVHLCLPKHILGVQQTTPNWSVLRECGHEQLQFYWFRAA